MKSIRIKNLRSLRDTGDVELKPITMLVGANSSGKSTFLRTFPLFKQGLGVNKQGPILWYGNDVDFGSYDEALRRDADAMQFTFKWDNLQSEDHYFAMPSVFNDGMKVECCFNIAPSGYNSFVKEIVLMVDGIQIEVNLSMNKIPVIKIENKTISEIVKFSTRLSYGAILPILHVRPVLKDNVAEEEEAVFPFFYDSFTRSLLSQVEILSREMEGVEYSGEIYSPFLKSEYLLDDIINRSGISLSAKKRAAILQSDSWDAFRKSLIAYHIDDVLEAVDRAMQTEFNGCVYIKPFRAYAERYYRIQNLAVKNLDSDGHNMAMIFENMSRRNALAEFNDWTDINFKFSVKVKRSRGHVSLLIKETNALNYANITDKGFGYSQILPIILSLWQVLKSIEKKSTSHNRPKIIAFEQPELHLHPKLQAMTMDAIITICRKAAELNYDLRFIIETHSPVLINRLGLRIAEDNSLREKASVLVFNEWASDNPSVSVYDNAGYLVNWPLGFFEPDL